MLPAVLVIGALYLARSVLIPVALAVLLSFILTPLVTRLQRLVRSRGLAVACVTLTAVAMAGGGAFAVGHQFVGLAARLPEYQDTIARKVRSIRESTRGVVSDAAQTLRTIGSELAEKPTAGLAVPAAPALEPGRTGAGAPAGIPPTVAAPDPSDPRAPFATIVGLVRPLVSPVATGLIVILLLSMMMYSREAIRDRVIRLAGLRQISVTTQAMEETGDRVGGYLRAQSLINLIYGVIVYLGLLFLGVPNAAVCGIIAGVLRFVPIVGIWLGAALPAAMAIAVFDGWGHLVLVVSLIVVLELIANFILEPWLYGSSTGISSIGVVAAIIFWTAIWGGVGLILAMPMTVCVMVFARQFPRLALVPILFGDEPVLSDSDRFYQRVLGGNEDDAAAVLRTPPAATAPGVPQSMLERLDSVVIPAMGTARRESIKGAISEARAIRVVQGVRDVALDWIGELPGRAPATPGGAGERVRAVCLPVNDEGDECAGLVLAASLENQGVDVSVLSASLRLHEMLGLAKDSGAEVVLLSAIAPSSELYTRRVCKAVRRAMPGAKVVVCAWGGVPVNGGDIASGADALVTSLAAVSGALVRERGPPGEQRAGATVASSAGERPRAGSPGDRAT